jgi:hypothetical protein
MAAGPCLAPFKGLSLTFRSRSGILANRGQPDPVDRVDFRQLLPANQLGAIFIRVDKC